MILITVSPEPWNGHCQLPHSYLLSVISPLQLLPVLPVLNICSDLIWSPPLARQPDRQNPAFRGRSRCSNHKKTILPFLSERLKLTLNFCGERRMDNGNVGQLTGEWLRAEDALGAQSGLRIISVQQDAQNNSKTWVQATALSSS